MNEIEFMRWLTSIGIYDEHVAYHNTCDPIRGYWSVLDTCSTRDIVLYDLNMNEVYLVHVDGAFEELVGEHQRKILEIFEI